MRYPPAGIRGVAGLTRASRFGRVNGYAGRAEQEPCLLVQVETRQSLDAIEELAAVDGVDGIFLGPRDLSASLGHPGEMFHPHLVAAVAGPIPRRPAAGRSEDP